MWFLLLGFLGVASASCNNANDYECVTDCYDNHDASACKTLCEGGMSWHRDACDIIYGCTNSTAFNYDASANTDDGSCRDVCGVPDGSSLCLKSNGGTLISETDEPGLMAAYSALKCEY